MHYSRLTQESLTHYSRVTHESRITHESLTSHYSRVTHESLTHYSRVTHESIMHYSRVTTFKSHTSHALLTSHSLLSCAVSRHRPRHWLNQTLFIKSFNGQTSQMETPENYLLGYILFYRKLTVQTITFKLLDRTQFKCSGTACFFI